MTDTTKRERVAQAIFAADGTDADWKWEPSRWERARPDEVERYLRLADAAMKELGRPADDHHHADEHAMTVKAIEIRDRNTFIPALVIRMTATNEAQRCLMARVGFHGEGVVLMRLNDQEAHSDPYDWLSGARTMPQAHLWLREHFDEIEDGAVIDVEFILGESASPKAAEAKWS